MDWEGKRREAQQASRTPTAERTGAWVEAERIALGFAVLNTLGIRGDAIKAVAGDLRGRTRQGTVAWTGPESVAW
jgi:hypothetical protein